MQQSACNDGEAPQLGAVPLYFHTLLTPQSENQADLSSKISEVVVIEIVAESPPQMLLVEMIR